MKLPNGEITYGSLMKVGYYMIRKRIGNGRVKREYVHRLVAKYFLLDKPEGKNEVSHLNDVKTDNRVENLCWMTHRENMNWGTSRHRIARALSGRRLPDEVRHKLSLSHIGKKRPDISQRNIDTQWFNNGVVNIRAKDCPDGFVAGMLPLKLKQSSCQANL